MAALVFFSQFTIPCWGMWWRSWLRHCATNRKVVGTIPHGVTGIFHWHKPSNCTMALGTTQPLTEMSTSSIYWAAKGWRPYHLHVLTVMKSGSLNLLEPSRPVKRLLYLYLLPLATGVCEFYWLLWVTCTVLWLSVIHGACWVSSGVTVHHFLPMTEADHSIICSQHIFTFWTLDCYVLLSGSFLWLV